MALEPWNIRPSSKVERHLEHYKADKAVSANFARLVEDLATSSNPASIGVPKKGRHGGCLGTHITKSVVLVYSVDYKAHRIDLIWMGDHKTVNGRDG